LEQRDPGVTTAWWKEERGERIFIDFNQNCRDRTIASAYSLRPKAGAPVSTPLTWEELGRGAATPRHTTCSRCPTAYGSTAIPGPRSMTSPTRSSPLLRLYEESGLGEMPFPPDYPKMPGEPPRVQPSKKVAAHWDADGNRIPD
jgi:hypothetical protein